MVPPSDLIWYPPPPDSYGTPHPQISYGTPPPSPRYHMVCRLVWLAMFYSFIIIIFCFLAWPLSIPLLFSVSWFLSMAPCLFVGVTFYVMSLFSVVTHHDKSDLNICWSSWFVLRITR